MRTAAIFVIGLISIANSVIAIIKFRFPLTVNFCRPIIVILFFSGLRKSIHNILLSLFDSMVILVSISAYIAIYCMIGFSFFRAGNQGLTVFTSMN